jgi:hypothetical protein
VAATRASTAGADCWGEGAARLDYRLRVLAALLRRAPTAPSIGRAQGDAVGALDGAVVVLHNARRRPRPPAHPACRRRNRTPPSFVAAVRVRDRSVLGFAEGLVPRSQRGLDLAGSALARGGAVASRAERGGAGWTRPQVEVPHFRQTPRLRRLTRLAKCSGSTYSADGYARSWWPAGARHVPRHSAAGPPKRAHQRRSNRKCIVPRS